VSRASSAAALVVLAVAVAAQKVTERAQGVAVEGLQRHQDQACLRALHMAVHDPRAASLRSDTPFRTSKARQDADSRAGDSSAAEAASC
jgi:hypothetical protein